MKRFFQSTRSNMPTGVFVLLLICFAGMALGAALPHAHGAMESKDQCPLHLFAKQAQGQSLPWLAGLIVSLFLSAYILVPALALAGCSFLAPSLARAPPSIA